jgi:hypothetical protein
MASTPGSRLRLLPAIGYSLSLEPSDTIEFRLAHRVGRLRRVMSAARFIPSSVFGSPLSDIVKRKHIRSNRMVEKLETCAVRLVLRWIDEKWRGRESSSVFRRLFSVVCLEHLSRGPRLTARLPDVFEAKLVFSTERALPSALSVYRGEFGRRRSEDG